MKNVNGSIQVVTIIASDCHEIPLPHQSHNMSIAWPWSRARNTNSKDIKNPLDQISGIQEEKKT